MLYQPATQPHPVRLQGVYVSDREINAVASFWRAQGGIVDAIPYRVGSKAEPIDEMLPAAAMIAQEYRTMTASVLSRRLTLPYARSAAILELLLAGGTLGEPRDGIYPVR
jgi:S-DNA-T family DNA segregation ATPase FtsK/SpoIIIE